MARTRLVIKDKGLSQLLKMREQLSRKPYVKVGVLGAAEGRTSVRRGREARVSKDKEGRITGARGGVAGTTTTRTSPTTSRGEGLDNVALAVIHEFGVPQKRIPSRPFLRSTFDAKRDDWRRLLERMAPQVLRGKLSVEQALGLLGQRASADVKRRITTGSNFVPNAPITIARKGSSRPLIDTGRLMNSISYVVHTGGA
jgi:phage gpG-like protein